MCRKNTWSLELEISGNSSSKVWCEYRAGGIQPVDDYAVYFSMEKGIVP
jgi:hypothetical protein